MATKNLSFPWCNDSNDANSGTTRALKSYPLSRTTGLKFLAVILAGSRVVVIDVQTLPELISRSPAGLPLLGVWSAHHFPLNPVSTPVNGTL